MIKNILLDCDGVLYPLTELPTKNIVEAMKFVYRNDVGLKPDEQKMISEKTISEEHLGMFNYIKEICYCKNYDFNLFCKNMTKQIDYMKIRKNEQMWQTLQSMTYHYNVGIFTNNSRAHLDKIFKQVFAKDISQVEGQGIKAYDIRSTEHGGYFLPKQDKKGFALFLAKLGMKPEETILLDDTQINIKRAKDAGMQAILITPEKSVINELRKISGTIVRQSKVHE